MAILEHAKCESYDPMHKVMLEYFEMGLGDLIKDLIEHKNKPYHKRMSSYHKELEFIYVRMINVLVSINQQDRY